MQNTSDFIMYFSLLGLYIHDSQSTTKLDPLPRKVLEHYLIDTMEKFIGKTFHLTEEEIIEISKLKVKSGEISRYLLEYGKSMMK